MVAPKPRPTQAACLTALMSHVPELSYRQLDRLAGLSEPFSAGIANGNRPNTGYSVMERIAPVLGVKPSDLLGEGGNLARKKAVVRAAVLAACHAQGVTLASPTRKRGILDTAGGAR